MKATLVFNLPDDEDLYFSAIHGWKYRHILSELDNKLREKFKYGDKTDIRIQEVREMVWSAVKELNLEL